MCVTLQRGNKHLIVFLVKVLHVSALWALTYFHRFFSWLVFSSQQLESSPIHTPRCKGTNWSQYLSIALIILEIVFRNELFSSSTFCIAPWIKYSRYTCIILTQIATLFPKCTNLTRWSIVCILSITVFLMLV